MANSDVEVLILGIKKNWASPIGDKAKAYVGRFSDRIRLGTKIVAKVVGNFGTYTVSIQIDPQLTATSACSCYIGKGGFCHHCAALAKTFLKSPESFIEKVGKNLSDVRELGDIAGYLESVTLEKLIARLKERGISQKALAASIGMRTQHLSAIKSSERNNRFFHELGVTKLACLWILEHCRDVKSENQ